jgi:hypothetical protein
VQRSCKNYVVKRRKKRLTDLILAHCGLAELAFVASRFIGDISDIGCIPTIAIVTLGSHDSGFLSICSSFADLWSGLHVSYRQLFLLKS